MLSSISILSLPKTIIKLRFVPPFLIYCPTKLDIGVNGVGFLNCPGLSSTHIISTPTS